MTETEQKTRDEIIEKAFFPCNPKRTDIQMAKKYLGDGWDLCSAYKDSLLKSLQEDEETAKVWTLNYWENEVVVPEDACILDLQKSFIAGKMDERQRAQAEIAELKKCPNESWEC